MSLTKVQPVQIQAVGIAAGAGIIADGAGEAIWGPAGGAIFGSEYQYEESRDETSTTDTVNWTTKLQLTTPVTLPAGTYRVCASWQCKASSNNREFEYRWVVDGVTTTQRNDIGYDEYQQVGGFVTAVLTGGIHTIELEFRVADSGTSYMREATIDFWRIS